MDDQKVFPQELDRCRRTCVAVGHFAFRRPDPCAAAPIDVYLIRGLANVFSLGMDGLAEKLKQRGYNASVYNYKFRGTIASSISDKSRSGSKRYVVVIGHSLGADVTFQIAESLNQKNIPVDLIVTFDATVAGRVPPNVAHFVNYYQDNNFGKAVLAGAGFTGELNNVNLTANTELRHGNLDESEELHALIIRKITEVTEVTAPEKAPKPKARKLRPRA